MDCDVTVLEKGILPAWQAIPLAKDSPYTPVVAKTYDSFINKYEYPNIFSY